MTDQPKEVFVVDDHRVILEGLRSALQKEPDFHIIGTANDGLEAIEMVKSLKPDIVIMDNVMPNLDGLMATKEIKQKCEATRIIIYSMLSDKELVVSLFKEGISGYVLKGQPLSELIMALKSVAMGGTFYSEAIGASLQKYMTEDRSGDQGEDILENLSPRETEIFLLLADGVPIKKIADRFSISPKTVETHKYNMMDKLNVKSVAGLTKIAAKKKLIKI